MRPPISSRPLGTRMHNTPVVDIRRHTYLMLHVPRPDASRNSKLRTPASLLWTALLDCAVRRETARRAQAVGCSPDKISGRARTTTRLDILPRKLLGRRGCARLKIIGCFFSEILAKCEARSSVAAPHGYLFPLVPLRRYTRCVGSIHISSFLRYLADSYLQPRFQSRSLCSKALCTVLCKYTPVYSAVQILEQADMGDPGTRTAL